MAGRSCGINFTELDRRLRQSTRSVRRSHPPRPVDGAAFTQTSGNPPGTGCYSATDDKNAGIYYIGTDRGVFESADGGVSATQTNLKFRPIYSLDVDDTAIPSVVYAGTVGNGVIS